VTTLEFDDLFDLRLPAYLLGLTAGPANDLEIVIEEATGQGPPLPNRSTTDHPIDEVLNSILADARPIEPGHGDRIVKIVWNQVVSFAVLDESYAGPERSGPAETPQLFSIVEGSWFDDYTAAATWATDEFPGPLTHYSLVTLNRVVSVISDQRPIVELVGVHS
jgi:hypothetical protein